MVIEMGIGEKFKNIVDKTVDKVDSGIDKICGDGKKKDEKALTVEERLELAKKPGIDAKIMHKYYGGKIETVPKACIRSFDDFSIWYSPGVAEPCKDIAQNPDMVYEHTWKWNTVAVVSDGTRVLGLGDIGPEAAMPVMEGKSMLFKYLGGVDCVPICLDTKDPDKIIETVRLLAPSFGGINLEDISAPRCFEIERKLKEKCDIPIFHDDQHGTAVITLAGLTNALKVVGKKKEDVRVVTSGAGAAAIAIVKLLLSAGFRNVTMCDRKGAIYAGRGGLNWIKAEMAEVTNLERRAGTLAEMLVGADVFIGVSAPGTVTTEMVRTMNRDAIVFACANPTPEIFPDAGRVIPLTEPQVQRIKGRGADAPKPGGKAVDCPQPLRTVEGHAGACHAFK